MERVNLRNGGGRVRTIAMRRAKVDKVISPEEKLFLSRKAENSQNYLPNKTGWTSAAPGPLSPIGKEFQSMVLSRDWNSLFAFLPIKYWGKNEVLGKYSFKDIGGKRVYIPFTRGDIESFVFSPYYTVQPGYTCSNAQRALGVDANVHGMNRHGKKFSNNDPRHIWPIVPGSGYGSQSYGCEKPHRSTWVKIRKPVVAAVAIVAAVYLGPAALTFIQNSASTMTGGLIPAAGGGAGAATGGAAGAAAGAGGTSAVTAATTGQKILSGAKTLVGYVNKANTIKAIAKGELPPIPIGIGGASFGQWAMIVAKEKIKEEAMDAAMTAGTKYIEKKMTQKEEAALKAEIEKMQRELVALQPKEIKLMPPMPDPELAAPIKQIQQVEVKRADEMEKYLVPGLIVASALIFGG